MRMASSDKKPKKIALTITKVIVNAINIFFESKIIRFLSRLVKFSN